MKVGLTYDLRQDYLNEGFGEEETAEFDRPDTIDAIENALKQLNYTTERIGNARQLMAQLAQGKRWDIVFNICEGMYGIGREAQVPAILDVYNIPYTFSDVLVSSLTLHKGMTKKVIRDSEIPTPDFVVVEKLSDIEKVNFGFPLFAKPVAEGTGKGVNEQSKIKNKVELENVCKSLLEKYNQPVLVEAYLPGREFTVGIVGTGENARSIGVLEVILKDKAEKEVYSYYNKEFCEELVLYVIKEDSDALQSQKVALDAWRCLGCRDGGRIDIRFDQHGVANFLEVNPLAGLHPEHSDLPITATQKGIAYVDLIKMIMDSAVQRVK